ncbi:MAG: hypothetical protein N7Q72_04045 [Spiroplasma sp. Tabriz.8]|nr:hypothetical protein [Spiroplasma sp. Tabriz.8]
MVLNRGSDFTTGSANNELYWMYGGGVIIIIIIIIIIGPNKWVNEWVGVWCCLYAFEFDSQNRRIRRVWILD